MESANLKSDIPVLRSNRYFNLTVIIIILAVIGLSAYTAFQSARSQTTLQAKAIISQQELAENYGLSVSLAAVTAVGGMLDVRLKIVDGEKARALLGDQANYPVIRTSNGEMLRTSENIASQPIQFEDGGNIYSMYMVPHSLIKSGDPVSIVFGDLQLEPIIAK